MTNTLRKPSPGFASLALLLTMATAICAQTESTSDTEEKQTQSSQQDRQAASSSEKEQSSGSRSLFSQLWRRGNGNANHRESDAMLTVFKQVLRDVAPATVQIYKGFEKRGYGAIVDANGYVLTKASELQDDGDLEVEMRDGRTLDAKVVGVHRDHDLAMLKIEAERLPVIPWAPSSEVPIGTWVVTPGMKSEPEAIGVVSVVPRWIRGGVLGVYLEEHDEGALIWRLNPNGGGAKGGLKRNDVLTRVNGNRVADVDEAIRAVGAYLPGDQIKLTVQRGEDEVELTARLDSIHKTFNNQRALFQNSLGVRQSDRRAGFPLALQHDSDLDKAHCGGPLVNLDGQVVAINIARQNRVASLAIPASTIIPLLDDLKSGKLAPQPTDKQAEARQGLEQRIESLTKSVKILEQKLQTAKERVSEARQAADGNSADGLQQALIQAMQTERKEKKRLEETRARLQSAQGDLEKLAGDG